MTSIRSLFHDSFTRRRTLLILAALVLTALVPLAGATTLLPAGWSLALLAAGALLAMIALLRNVRPGAGSRGARAEDASRPGAGLLLYLSPVILLNLVYPLVSPAMAAVQVGGVQLTHVVLASSITVPWLAQAACLPAYRAIGDLMAERHMAAIVRRFCSTWPAMFVFALPLVVVFAVPLWLATGWSLTALGTYAALVALHLLFVQALIMANVANRRGLWAAAWAAYAAALFLGPTLWWLPPLLGALTQIAAMGRGLAAVRLRGLDPRHFSADLLRGLLLGAVLWADKFVLFLVTDGDFQVVVVFLAMLPAVLAYNYYFVNLAPQVDRAVASLHQAIAQEPLTLLAQRSRTLSRTADRAILTTGAAGMLLTLAVCLLMEGLQPAQVLLAAAVGVASWAFMVLTLLSYELDYIGEKLLPQILGGVHLMLCAAAFLLIGAGTAAAALAYAALAAADLALVAAAWVLYKRHWTQPEYTLFWRHATSW
ncbi:hypothetical protein BN1051_03028 [Arthrobacter saudimassiliensis]|uniref:Polysaccharide biosynthesis protein n=1 Tax=Arthrobacter saudimassiliensis TaxID=1461584 RepID=A0A078MXY1_9MICC|nr:hypothetical protein BN1051_03028 [Arthrobacter saudimassiliensis]